MDFDLPKALGVLLLIIVVGVGGVVVATPMQTSTVMMMVLPSMLVFAAIAFGLGVKHGEYRASH
jgi:hypothetical protein